MITHNDLVLGLQEDNPAALGYPGGGGLIWDEGIIVRVDPDEYLYTVEGDYGSTYTDIRRISNGLGSVDLLPVGCRVALLKGPPRGPYIFGVVAFPPNEDGTLMRHLEGADGRVRPGDNVVMGLKENFVAARSDGSAILHATPMAHISATQDGHVNVFANTYRHSSAFGEAEISKNGDGVGYSLRAGSSYSNHTGPTLDESWTLRIDAGAVGRLLDVRVTTPGGTTLGQFHMSNDGSIQMVSESSRFAQIFGSETVLVGENYIEAVDRDSTSTVKGTRSETYQEYVHQCRTGHSVVVGGTRQATVVGNELLTVAGDQISKVMGASINEVSGEYQHIIAPTYGGAVPLRQSATWVNYSGGFNFVLQPTAAGSSFNVVSSIPGSVNLGIDGAPAVFNPLTGKHELLTLSAPYSAVLYEPLFTWLNLLMAWLTRHTHGSAVGPTSPAIEPPGPSLNPTLSTFQSKRVRIGL